MEPKVILVTGASSGIGKATAARLLQEGHIVYATARRVALMQDLRDAGGHVLEMDMTDELQLSAVVATILADHGRIDVLVNNAGIPVYGAVEQVPLDEARQQFEVNLFGLARLVQLVLPGMRQRQGGTIINLSSMGGVIHTPLGAWYHASKHALEAFSDCLRYETAAQGIAVVLICPGAIETGFNAELAQSLQRRGEGGPYAALNARFAATVAGSRGSPAAEVAATISRAVAARRPRTRYRVGRFARLLPLLRHLLGDRGFDRLLGMVM